ncbi:hypothetical protein [Myroides sp. LoEW2-1]|uniref:hypothetical protein n=1 Tax=Myroides sp. LoEW2-1 TaxID=2683192 RepID=UPI001321A4F7|nr:hypothetical protein [Myroides sp. LoEW2-1]MVX36578.1 hypothetical protein [Myroides sp. LoEW2-1]
MKKNIIILSTLALFLSSTLTENAYAQKVTDIIGNISQDKVAKGLKEALDKGIEQRIHPTKPIFHKLT